MKTRLYGHFGRFIHLKWGTKKKPKGDNSIHLVTLVTNLVISHEHTLCIFKFRTYHFHRIYCYLIIKYIFQKEDYVPPKYFRLFKENTPECVFIIMGCVASGINGCTMPIFAIVFGEMIKVFIMVGWFMVFNTTCYNISVISWRSVLLEEETGETTVFIWRRIIHLFN